MIRLGHGTSSIVMPCECSDETRARPSSRPDDDPDHGAEDGQDHRLRADHRPDLPAFHADGTQQADLVGALEDRQHQRVHDPDRAR